MSSNAQTQLIWLENLIQDLNSAMRSLSRSRFFAAVVVSILALGIGITSALFAVINVALLHPLPNPDPQRLVWLQEYSQHHETSGGNPLRLVDWQRARSFSAICGVYKDRAIFETDHGPIHLRVLHTVGNPHATLAPTLLMGRTFTAAENRGEGSPVALITASAWRRYLSADPSILRRTLYLGSNSYQIVGVLNTDLTQGMQYPEGVDIWAPISASEIARTPRQAGYLGEIARLAPGTSIEAAEEEIKVIASQIATLYPATDRGRSADLQLLQEHVAHEAKRPLLTLLAAASVLLLIACVNIAGLLIARGLTRQREAAIRISVGAGRGRLARMFFMESLILAAIGCGLGLLVASLGVDVLKFVLPQDIPQLGSVHLDGSAVAFAAGISALSALLFGGLPAWQFALQGQSPVLKSGGRSIAGSSSRVRSALVVVEIALSLMLLVTTGLLADSFFRLRNQPAGFQTTNVYSFAVPFSWDTDPNTLNTFASAAILRLTTTQGVVAAGVVDELPLHGGTQSGRILVQGMELDDALGEKQFSWRTATSGYFAAAGIPIKSGSVYQDWSGGHGSREVVITDRLASTLFPHEDPLNHFIAESPRGKSKSPLWFRIVGVVSSIKLSPSDRETEAGIYVPWGATYWPGMNFVVKSTRDLNEFTRLVRNHVQPLTDKQIVENVATLESLTAETHSDERVRTILLAAFSGAALALSAIGLFGTLSHEVSRRTQDFGVRLALGAQPSSIAWLAVKSALVLSILGIVIGAGASIWTAQFLRSLLFGVEPWDARAYLGASLVLAVTAVLAAGIPAARAARIDPINALHHD